jgi:hypothetical protein
LRRVGENFSEVDINPAIANADGLHFVDVRVIVGR